MVQTRKRDLSVSGHKSPVASHKKSSKVEENVDKRLQSLYKLAVVDVQNASVTSPRTPRRSRRLSTATNDVSASANTSSKQEIGNVGTSPRSPVVKTPPDDNTDATPETQVVKSQKKVLRPESISTPSVRLTSKRLSAFANDLPTSTKHATRRAFIDEDLPKTNSQTPTRRSTRRLSITTNDVNAHEIDQTHTKHLTDKTPLKPSTKRKSLLEDNEINNTPRRSTRRNSLLEVEPILITPQFQTPTQSLSRRLSIISPGQTKTNPSLRTPKKLVESFDPPSLQSSVRRSRQRNDLEKELKPIEESNFSDLESVLPEKEKTGNKVESVQKLPVIAEDEGNKTEDTSNGLEKTDAQLSISNSKTEKPIQAHISKKISDDTDLVNEQVTVHKESPQIITMVVKSPDLKLRLDLDDINSDNSEAETIIGNAISECTTAEQSHKAINKVNDKVEITERNNSEFFLVKGLEEKDEIDSNIIIEGINLEVQDKQEAVTTIALKNKEEEAIIANQTVSTSVDITNGPFMKQKEAVVDVSVSADEIPSSTTSTTILPAANDDQENQNLHVNRGLDNKVKNGESVEVNEKAVDLKSITRGLPLSGRWWKKEKQRFCSMNKNATGTKSWAKNMLRKKERREVMVRSAAIEAEKQKKKEQLKERQRLNKIRREENQRKSEIVQVIKDTRKLKKMKKKQLRYIEMRDTTDALQAK